MAIENAKKFLEELDRNEEALAMLNEERDVQDEEQQISLLGAAARTTGYDVTDGEILQLLSQSREIMKKTAKDAEKNVELSLDEMDAVAGGAGHDDCDDTYRDNENCIFLDNCKKLVRLYGTRDFGHNPIYCDSYAYCNNLMVKHDCKVGRVGF